MAAAGAVEGWIPAFVGMTEEKMAREELAGPRRYHAGANQNGGERWPTRR